MTQRTPRTRTYRLPVDIGERADRVAVELTIRERRPVTRQEVLERAVEIGLDACIHPKPHCFVTTPNGERHMQCNACGRILEGM